MAQIEQLQSQCCQLEKELARKQGDADVFKREAENKLAERMRVALREQQLEYESQVTPAVALQQVGRLILVLLQLVQSHLQLFGSIGQ